MKKILLLILCILVALPFSVSATALESKIETQDNMVLFKLTLTHDKVFGGSFNVVYDNTTCTFVDYEESEALQESLYIVNPEYAENKIRVTIASGEALANDAPIIVFRFSTSDGATAMISVENVRLSDENGNIIIFDNEDTEQPTEIETEPTAEEETKPKRKPSGGSSRNEKIENETQAEPETVTEENFEVELLQYSDISLSDWYYEAVKYVTENDIMNGVGDDLFAPNEEVTRAMLVTIIYRVDGNASDGKAEFTDVMPDAWYSSAVAWAAKNKIVNGIGDGLFAPETYITREQIAVMLYNYAEYKGYDVSQKGELSSFTDADEVSAWAKPQVEWAVGSGIMNGKLGMKLDAKGNATRAEIATVVKRFIQLNQISLQAN